MSPWKRYVILAPLVVFLGWAGRHLAEPGPLPFFQRWIDVSMGFTLALVAMLVLKKILIDKDKDDEPHDKPPASGDRGNSQLP
jgi:hypothetical protein